MARRHWVFGMCGAATAALVGLSGPASAGGLFDREAGSVKDAPADTGRQFSWSFNIGGVSEYVFRGISQTREDPVIQGGVDVSYGILYAGIWASGLDFGGPPSGGVGADAQVEIDWYAGIKPTWGKATFDFGVIYYTYPGAHDPLAELDYVEFKAGVSGTFIDKLTTGVTLYVSPEYTGEVGTTYVVEGTASYELPKFWIFTPSISGTVGGVFGNDNAFKAFFGDDNYVYWNAGVSLVVDKLTLDFRYWDTDLDTLGGVSCTNTSLFGCDERFVFSAKVTLP